MSNVIQFPSKVENAEPVQSELDTELEKLAQRFSKTELTIAMLRLMGEAYAEETEEIDNPE